MQRQFVPSFTTNGHNLVPAMPVLSQSMLLSRRYDAVFFRRFLSISLCICLVVLCGDQDTSGAANPRMSEADTEMDRLAALSDTDLRSAVAEHPDWKFPKKLNLDDLGPLSESHATAIRTRLLDEWESISPQHSRLRLDRCFSVTGTAHFCILICVILAFLSAIPC